MANEPEPEKAAPDSFEAETRLSSKDDKTMIETYRIEEIQTSDQDTAVTTKAKQSGKALKDLILALANKTKTTAVEKSQQLKEAAHNEQPVVSRDSADIHRLGDLVDGITTNFDDTMDIISHESYDIQEKMLVGYRKVLEEEVNVISARLNMAKRLAPVASRTDTIAVESRNETFEAA